MRLRLLVPTVVVAMLHVAPLTAIYSSPLRAAPARHALAIPPLPFSPYGTVLVDGVAAANGTVVSAWCGGVKYKETATQMSGGASWYYNLDIPGDDPETGAKEGCSANETVTFKAGSLTAAQTAPWASTSYRLNLDAATPTATPTKTASPSTTPSATPVYSPTIRATPTPTRAASATPTKKGTATRTPSATLRASPTRTPTKKATRTPTRTPTKKVTRTPVYSPTPTRSTSITPTRTPTKKAATLTATRTPTQSTFTTPTRTPTKKPTATRTPTRAAGAEQR